MPSEVALFWAVLAAFLVADNLVLVPRGGDFLKFGWRGALRYEAGARLQARGRDLLLLNPLNPFERVVLTPRAMGKLQAAPYRLARKMVVSTLPALNRLSWLGCVYGVLLLMLMALSTQLHFGLALATLAVVHVCLWLVATLMLVSGRQALRLSGYQCFTLAAEALFVPAYTLNLGKRVWYRHSLDLPALALGLWQAKQLLPGPQRELASFKLQQRVDDLAVDIDPADVPLNQWVKEARQCLKASATSAALAGS